MEVCHWLGSLTLLALGGTVLLQKLTLVPVTLFDWVWPVTLVVWGVVGLYHSACKECHH